MKCLISSLLCLFVVSGPALPVVGQTKQGKEKARTNPRLDRYGDPLPKYALMRLGTIRFRHGAPIERITYSSNGKLLITGCRNGVVCVWQAKDGKELQTIRAHKSKIRALALSPDNKILASGGEDQMLLLHDPATGKKIRRLGKYLGILESLAFSRDGKWLAAASSDGSIRIWSAAGKHAHTLQGHRTRVTSVVFSSDGKKLYSAGDDRDIHVWDTNTGRELRPLKGHYSTVSVLALSPDGKTLASAGGDSNIHIWNATTGLRVRYFRNQYSGVTQLAFSPDGRYLASGDRGRYVRVWDVNRNVQLYNRMTQPFYPLALAFSPDSKKLVVSIDYQSSLHFWDAQTGKVLKPHQGHIGWGRAVAVAPDAKKVVTGSLDGTLIVWDRATGKLLREFESHKGGILGGLAISADGKYVAAAGTGRYRARLYNLSTGLLLRSFGSSYTGSIYSAPVTFSPDGKELAAGISGSVYLYNVNNGSYRRNFYYSGYVYSLAYSPDGKEIVAAGTSSSFYLWNTSYSGRSSRSVGGHSRSAFASAYSPDGRMIATMSADSTLRIWERTSLQPRRTIYIAPVGLTARLSTSPENYATDGYSHVLFSPDSRYVVAGNHDKRIRIWDLATGKELPALAGHRGWIRSLAFSRDGKYLVSMSDDTTALVWDFAQIVKDNPLTAIELNPSELPDLWQDLGDREVKRAYQSVTILARAPDMTIPFIRSKLLKKSVVSIKKLIGDLGHKSFRRRERATMTLISVGKRAETELRDTLAANNDLEVHRRIQRVLAKIQESSSPSAAMQIPRAVEILERIATPAAHKLLTQLSKQGDGDPAAAEAREALQRLNVFLKKE